MTDVSANAPDESSSSVSYRRWFLLAFLAAILGAVMWTVINPYRNQSFEEIPHGDHVHYVPKDRNEDVSISRFPTRPPNEGERITPDGEIVPANR
jgi:hypothetical protein